MYRHMDRDARVSTKTGKRKRRKSGQGSTNRNEDGNETKKIVPAVVRDIKTINAQYTLPATSVIRIPIYISHAIECSA